MPKEINTIIEKDESFKKLNSVLDEIKEHCKQKDKDWVCLVSGMEGAGKSILALQLAQLLDPQFDAKKQTIRTWNKEHGYLDFIQKYRNDPFKSVVFDEDAVIRLLQNNERDTKASIKIFNANSNTKHFPILVVPSPWTLDKDMREQRVGSFFYVFRNKETNDRYFAYYSAKKMTHISQNESLRKLFRHPDLFMKQVHPDFIEKFPKIENTFTFSS